MTVKGRTWLKATFSLFIPISRKPAPGARASLPVPGSSLCSELERRKQKCWRSTRNARIGPAILTAFPPQATLPRTLIDSPPGGNVQLRVLLSNFVKSALFSQKGRDFQPPAPILCGIFMGMAWGEQKGRRGEVRGRNCLRKPCFSGFFRTSFNCSDTPEGEKNEDGRGMAWGR